MPQLIYNIDHYLYTTKRDAYILELKNQSDRIFYECDNPLNIEVEKSQLKWLDDHGVTYAPTCPSTVLEGWLGHYYVDFANAADPNLIEYSRTFEDEDGIKSKYPDKFQLYVISYEDWASDGKLAEYEQYLIDREDPNWEY